MEDPQQERREQISDQARREAEQSPFKQRSKSDLAEQQEIMRETGPYMTLGIQLALSVALFFGVGWWLDKHFGTTPLWTAIFIGGGAVLSLIYFIVTVTKLSQKSETKRR